MARVTNWQIGRQMSYWYPESRPKKQFAAIFDTRIKAVVGWDPVDALPPFGNDGSMSVTPEMMGALRVPFAVIGELTDSTGHPVIELLRET